MHEKKSISRRSFTVRSLAAISAAGVLSRHARLQADEVAGRAIRLGAPVFGVDKNDPEALAAAHKALGYRAAYCPKIDLEDRAAIRATEAAFAQQDIVLAEVGRWVNLLDADPVQRKANFDTVAEGLALADEVGALCCVDIAGSYCQEYWSGPHPKNLSDEFFDAAVENARKLIDTVKPKRAKFCYEMMWWALPDTADSYVRMIEAVDRPEFGAHLDPSNLINAPSKIYDTAAVINESFDKLGPYLVSCHAKDVAWERESQVHFREVELGEGELDYGTYLNRLARLPHDVPLMIEHMKGAEAYDRCREHLFRLAPEVGVRFQ